MKTIYVDGQENLNIRKLKRMVKKLCKISKKEEIVIALSKSLKKHENINEIIKEYNFKVLDGRWLFKFLLYDILEYISKTNDKKMETQSVAILMKNMDEIVMQELPDIAKKVKSLKIVSDDFRKFSYMEENLYLEYGIALQITNNKKKSLSNVDIIINFDFDEEKINEYIINPYAIVINIKKKVNLNFIGFKGKNINNYIIKYNEEKFENFCNKENFDNNILYESYIYRKDTFLNIRKQLEEDDVKIIKLA